MHPDKLVSKPIALIGLPGSGKSTVGRHLARKCQLDFYDSDSFIEEQVGCTIRQLFERDGESRFREIEIDVINQLTLKSNSIISTGGGAVLNEVNREHLRSRCYCIYLRSTPEDLFRRLRHDRKRPLLQVADPLEVIKKLFDLRDPLYQDAATFTIETGRPSVASLVNTIAQQLAVLGLCRRDGAS